MKDIQENKRKLVDLISNIERQTEKLPILKDILNRVEQGEAIFHSYPDEENFPENIYSSLFQGLDFFGENTPENQPNSLGYIDVSHSLTISGGTSSYVDISRFNAQNQEQENWRYSTLNLFHAEWEKGGLHIEIEDFFTRVKAEANLDEFKKMQEFKKAFEERKIDHSAFANKMRNVILHFKGILKKASDVEKYGINGKPQVKKKKKESWPKMAKYIVQNSPQLRNDFIQHGRQWTKIHSDLSTILKNYKDEDFEKLISYYNEIISLLHAFINIVEEEKIKTSLRY